ncbi:MAG: HAD family hydrolase [Phocaeicola sp.]
MKKLIIFDLDGTLLNTIGDLAAAVNHALTHYGYPTHTEDACRFFVGNGITKLLERALPADKQTPQEVERLMAQFLPYYNAHSTDLTAPYAGTIELLKKLQAEGYKLAVASNKHQSGTSELVALYFAGIEFCSVLGQREGVETKPHPTIVYETIATAGVTPEETLYVGDSNVDMETAQNAGVDALGVAWGFRPRAELEAYKPLAVIDVAAELMNYLGK